MYMCKKEQMGNDTTKIKAMGL